MKPIKLKIDTKTQQYPIIIGSNLCSNISKIIKKNSINFKQCLIVIDINVPKNIISKIKKSLNKKKLYVHFFKASEINKTAVMIIVLRFQKIRHKNLKILYIYRLLEKVSLRAQASGKRLHIILFHQLGFIDNR